MKTRPIENKDLIEMRTRQVEAPGISVGSSCGAQQRRDRKRETAASQERHAHPVTEDGGEIAARIRERAVREVHEIHQPQRDRESARDQGTEQSRRAMLVE
jgi:hypothetical protein